MIRQKAVFRWFLWCYDHFSPLVWMYLCTIVLHQLLTSPWHLSNPVSNFFHRDSVLIFFECLSEVLFWSIHGVEPSLGCQIRFFTRCFRINHTPSVKLRSGYFERWRITAIKFLFLASEMMLFFNLVPWDGSPSSWRYQSRGSEHRAWWRASIYVGSTCVVCNSCVIWRPAANGSRDGWLIDSHSFILASNCWSVSYFVLRSFGGGLAGCSISPLSL